ncbi:MAG: DUF1553 domain-containing protein [Acidobacteriaceae bacterium]|nr:DUF1553 domain-containing protein [Acidobacteriaceae bacterium]
MVWLIWILLGAAGSAAADFVTEVRPILARRCWGCHGPALHKSDLRLDRRPDALHGGESGIPAIVPGNSKDSLLIRYVSGADAKLVMPPAGPRLTPAEVDTLRQWIDAGAKWPGAEPTAPSAAKPDPRRNHWAFQPLRAAPALPSVRDTGWVRNPIDAFILARLEAKGWRPAPPAAPPDLLRRIYLDLTGLPPSLAEQDRFRGDWDGLAQELLQQPAHAERWARHWLDVVRYGDTNGYERDDVKPKVWKYRDYVIRSLQADKPFNQFVIEQLAGDELPNANAETLLATGFLRLGPWDDEPADPAEDRFDQLDDILNATAQGFLGLTLACARCHNHKFEPLTTKDYYGMIAVFNGLERPRKGRTELDRPIGLWPAIKRDDAREEQITKLREAARKQWLRSGKSAMPPAAAAAFLRPAKDRDDVAKKLVKEFAKKLDEELAALPVEEKVKRLRRKTPELERGYFLEERAKQPPATHILIRGKAASPGPEVPPSAPLVVAAHAPPVFTPAPRSSGRRLGLARWIASRENPLTARVIVNRVWQWHFGEGLVRTANDFGVMGDKPSHPELLDWLAVWFMDNGWSLRKLHALILSSNTYRMAKTDNPAYAAEDPENRLWWRAPYRRLEAEAILDSALAVSGKLNRTLYGEFVYPEVPREALEGSSDPDKVWKSFSEEQASRRAIYYIVKRSLLVPLMEVLDVCDTARPAARRQTTSVAPQALQLFNGGFMNRQARHLAERLRREAGAEPAAQIEMAYRLALARPPKPAERDAMISFLRTGTLEELCRVMLNLNEFAYTN